MSEEILYPLEDGGYVIIERTGAFFVARDINGYFHLGTDIYSDLLSLPGGNIEESDRNLFVAARRETRQEFGRHMRYVLVDEEPIVFLCDINDDSWVQHPKPGQRVKLRVAFIVMEAHGNQPRQQKRKEMLNPSTFKITLADIDTLKMRESSRIAIRIALMREATRKLVYKTGLTPDIAKMRIAMRDLLVAPETYNFHGTKKVKSTPLKHQPDGPYLIRIRNSEREHRKKMREAKKRHRDNNRQMVAQASARIELRKKLKQALKEFTNDRTATDTAVQKIMEVQSSRLFPNHCPNQKPPSDDL